MTPPTAYERVTAALVASTGYQAANAAAPWLCPAHDDQNPSLAVSNGEGKVKLFCHAGCDTRSVVDALGLSMADLFDEKRPQDKPKIVKTYDYTDETGTLLYQVVRTEPKGFRQRRPDGDRWVWNLHGVDRIPYRLPELVEAVAAGRTVYVCEGEKDVDAVVVAGADATCNSGGAGKWNPSFARYLKGATVVIVADRDVAGATHALDVYRSLQGIAAKVTIAKAAVGKDAADHLGAGQSLEQLEVVDLGTLERLAGGEAVAAQVDDQDVTDELADLVAPIEWASFWASEPAGQEWVVENIVPAGRQVAMYAVAKAGKSLLALDAAAALASGRPCLGLEPVPPMSIIYIDQEMTGDDLRERLEDMGYGPEIDLSRLIYFQLVDLPALDTELGGRVLEAIVKRHGAQLVVIDTMARVVEGDENQADTYRAFYRHTGRRLKALRVALWRLDHGGKDPERGQRGSSEKAGDVDVVFRLHPIDGGILLRRTHTRVPWVPAEVRLEQRTEPLLAHLLAPDVVPPSVLDVIRRLDELGIPADASANTAHKALRDAGCGRRKTDVLSACKVRKARA